MRRLLVLLLATFAVGTALAAAPTPGLRAFLDRTHVSLGDVVTLNIQSHGALGTPDLAPLASDFEVLGTSSSSSVGLVNGRATRTSQIGIALKPLRAGTLTIPPLAVGGASTPPLTLDVAAGPTGGTGQVGDAAFMEASALSSAPYVGEQTVYTVRLFYLPGVDGSLGDPSADGARLVKLDHERDYMADRNGFAYKVIEYQWALIPQRAGSISVTGPVFQGRRLDPGGVGGWFRNPGALPNNPNALLNGLMSGFARPVSAVAPVVGVDARAAPAGAGKPWLPARDVQLTLTGVPASGALDAGQPLTLTLGVSAQGQPADALPEPQLPAIAGARVYPDPTQDTTDAGGEWLRGTRTRTFALVPDRNGTLTIPAITLDWWNVADDRAEQVRLPARTLRVSGVAAPPPGAPIASSGASARIAAPAQVTAPATAAAATGWRTLAIASLALWGLALVVGAAWWWRSRRAPARPVAASRATGAAPSPPSRRGLQRNALDASRAGDPAACERALLAWARAERAGIIGIEHLRDALSDAAQCDALARLQQARWAHGDGTAACAQVAAAFARGFAWREAEARPRAPADALPPLYPP